jgi:hypothetical protein
MCKRDYSKFEFEYVPARGTYKLYDHGDAKEGESLEPIAEISKECLAMLVMEAKGYPEAWIFKARRGD